MKQTPHLRGGTKCQTPLEDRVFGQPQFPPGGKAAVGLALRFEFHGIHLGVPLPERRSTGGGWISMGTAVTCLVREKEQPEECWWTDRPLVHARCTLRLARQEG
ncbi:unnamed protein product, partial [Ectocarpus sp. 8 AP-2014]